MDGGLVTQTVVEMQRGLLFVTTEPLHAS